jgi:hypothetical protein
MRLLKITFFLFFFFLFLQIAEAFEIKKIQVYPYKNQLVVTAFYKKFPFQSLVLALKSQKYPIFIHYTFEIYKKRFLFSDILLHKELYFQTLHYNPEKNLYFLKDNFGLTFFKRAEDAVLKVVELDSHPLKWKFPKDKKYLYLTVKVRIKYKTHLTDDLNYSKKLHCKTFESSKSISLDEVLGVF